MLHGWKRHHNTVTTRTALYIQYYAHFYTYPAPPYSTTRTEPHVQLNGGDRLHDRRACVDFEASSQLAEMPFDNA